MKHILSLVYFAGFLLASTDCASLRKVDGGVQIEVDLNEMPRNLQGQLPGSTYENTFENNGYEEGSDAGLLNELISFFLPHINSAFQAIIPDPFPLPFERSFELAEIDILACKASAAFNFDLGEIIGLSDMSIENLQVVPGTERVNAGCLETLWSGLFDMTISSNSIFSLQDMAAGFSASACGLNFDDEVTGGVNTYQPMMRGAVNISGNLFANIAQITLADIGDALEVGYDRVEGFLDDVPAAWNRVIADATAELGETMKNELVTTVEPEVNPKMQKSMEGRQLTMSYTQAFSLNSRFVRNGVTRSIRNAYQDTTNFFGGAIGLLGFGGDEDGPDE